MVVEVSGKYQEVLAGLGGTGGELAEQIRVMKIPSFAERERESFIFTGKMQRLLL